jgi:aryl-alcohol dehydrogenase-like predicted oxidoreductase
MIGSTRGGTMQTRALGSQGLVVSAIGLGCMGMSQSYGEGDDAESQATLEEALDLGITLFDTADVYGPLTNERLVGRVLGPHRDEVLIATKFGNERRDDGTWIGVNGRPDYLRACCDASLARLGTDHIDLYYQHRVDPSVPVEETFGALGELVEVGKVRFLGISEAAPDTIARAHRTHPLSAVQSEYSLFTRDPEDGVLERCRELGIGFVPFSPLGRGMLSGVLTSVDQLGPGDMRRGSPRFSEDNFDANLATVRRLSELAADKGVTPAQLALAWVLDRGADIVPIPGTKRRRYLEENVAALEIELSDEDRAVIDDVAPCGVAAGDRYAPEQMRRINL